MAIRVRRDERTTEYVVERDGSKLHFSITYKYTDFIEAQSGDGHIVHRQLAAVVIEGDLPLDVKQRLAQAFEARDFLRASAILDHHLAKQGEPA